MPIESPNPYGAFYAFGDIPGARPGPMGFDEHMGRALGQGGGNNPTQAENLLRRGMDRLTQEGMSDAIRQDARAGNMTDFILKQLYGGDQRKMNRAADAVGGAGNMREWVSALLNQQGVAGFAGGDIRSIRLGANAIAGGGGMVNVAGAGQSQMFGSGQVQNAAAQQIFESVNRRFWSASGAANISATSGLNRDQIGGIMTLGAQQGAFAGMDMGSISRSGDKMKFSANAATIAKIEAFTKEAAKSMAALADVFGNQSMGQLAAIAERVTGLNLKTGSGGVMAKRIAELKGMAQTYGVDNQSVLEMGAGITQMGIGAGLSGHIAGTMAHQAVRQGLAANAQLSASPGFFRVVPTAQEAGNQFMRNQIAMQHDPIGARIVAATMAMETGMAKGAGADKLRSAMGGLSRDNVGAFDELFRATTGMSAGNMISTFGGADKMPLSPEGQAESSRVTSENMRRRQVSRIGDITSRMFGDTGVSKAATILMDTFSAGELQKMASAYESGDTEGAIKIAMQESSVVKDRGQAAGLVGQLGAMGGNAGAKLRLLDTRLRSNPLDATFTSKTEDMRTLRLQDQVQMLSSSDERQLSGAFNRGIQGFLEMAGGEGPLQQLGLTAAVNPRAVHGMKLGDEVFLDAKAHEQAGGKLTGKGAASFAKTLQNLAVQDPEMAQRMGFSMKDFRDEESSAAYAKANFGRINNLLTDTLDRSRIFQGRTAGQGGEGRMIWGKTKEMVEKDVGAGISTASALQRQIELNKGLDVKANREADATSRFYGAVQKNLEAGGEPGPALDALYQRVTANADMIPRDRLTEFAKMDHRAGQALVEGLTQQLMKETDKEGNLTKAGVEAKEKIKILERAGVSAPTNVSKFVGVLQLIDGNGVSIKVSESK